MSKQRLLLIMPNFFDYPSSIMKGLNELGYTVDFFDDRPSTNPVVKAIIRLRPKWLAGYIEKYFNQIMNSIESKNYDVVFVISGQSLSFSEAMIKRLKVTQRQAKFILYQWDSLKNFPYIKTLEKYFDVCLTFDKSDAKSNSNLTFLPLFYSDKYKMIGNQTNLKFKYDFAFVGTAHPQKYKFIKQMSSKLKSVYPRQFVYYYLPSIIVYIYHKAMHPEYRHAKLKEFHFKPLTGSKYENIMVSSKTILDSSQAGQVGLTIRAIEALGSKKKLITTNSDIKNYDFFCEQNIYVYDDNDFDLKSKFFTTPYKDINVDIYKKYSLEIWLKTILFKL